MTVRWDELGPDGQATVEAAFVALETAARLDRTTGADPVRLSPSAAWAHVTGSVPLPRAVLAAAWLAEPAGRELLAGMLQRAALATGPRVAAAASGGALAERTGDGFRLRLLPARGALDQTWIMIALDRPDPAPTRLTVLPAAGPPESTALTAPVEGTVQLLAETGSGLVRALGDPAATVFLH
ncbi:MAG: hypothetical protein RLO51_18265 [Thalassobaculum sp.]|uniref:hypothetical protein n=1 Tax=Thalassobaculum sp. TaxID=2022740 RepID=UPI0032ED925F